MDTDLALKRFFLVFGVLYLVEAPEIGFRDVAAGVECALTAAVLLGCALIIQIYQDAARYVAALPQPWRARVTVGFIHVIGYYTFVTVGLAASLLTLAATSRLELMNETRYVVYILAVNGIGCIILTFFSWRYFMQVYLPPQEVR